jgi:hypothetical protein
MKNQPAFPQPEPIVNEFHPNYGKDRGMTLRDYFAAKAMQEFIRIDSETTFFGMPHPDANLKCSINAYAMADAMLKARGE